MIARTKPGAGLRYRLFILIAAVSLLLAPRVSQGQSQLPTQWVYNPIIWSEAVAYSPDGSLIAVGGSGGVQIFEVSTGSLVRCLATRCNISGSNSTIQAGVTSIAFSPNGQMLAVGGQHFSPGSTNLNEVGIVELWNVSTGALTATLNTAANRGVFSVAFSPNGQILADGGQSNKGSNQQGQYGVLELWNVPAGTLAESLATSTAAGGCVNSVAFSPDGTKLASGGETFTNNSNNNQVGSGGVIELWNISSGGLPVSLTTAAGTSVNSVAFSKDGQTLADGGLTFISGSNTSSGVLELWNLSNDKLIEQLDTAANDGVATVTFSPDGQSLADGGANGGGSGEIELWNLTSGSLVETFNTANPEVKSVAFSPDGTKLADGGSSNPGTGLFAVGVAEEWNVSTGAIIATLDTTLNSATTSIAISPDGKTLALGGSANQNLGGVGVPIVQLWDVASGVLERTVVVSGSSFMPVTAIAFSSDSKTLAVGSVNFTTATSQWQGVLGLWDVSSGVQTKSFDTALQFGVLSVAFSADGTMLAAGGKSTGAVEVWDVSTGKIIGTLSTPAGSGCPTVAFVPGSGTLAVGGEGFNGTAGFGVLQLWNASAGTLIKSLNTAATGGINSIAFTPDGSALVSGGAATNSSTGASVAELEIWGTTSGTRLSSVPLVSGTTRVISVAVSPDGKTLFAGTDTSLQAYGFANYGLLGYFADYDFGIMNAYPVNALCVSSTGNLLAYGSGQSIEVSANPFYSPVAVAGLSIDPNAVLGGTGATGTVTLAQAAPEGGDSVTLLSSVKSVGVPAAVTVPAGSKQATFSIGTAVLSSNTTAVITATSGGVSVTGSLSISNLSVSSLSLSPSSLSGGSVSSATVTLSGPAPAGGIAVVVSSSDPAAPTPPTITIPAGASTASFSIVTLPVNVQTAITLTVGTGSAGKSAVLTVLPAALTSLVVYPTSVVGGASCTGKVTISGPAGAGGLAISLSSTVQAHVPGSVTIPEGSNSELFTITTEPTGSKTSATITATFNGLSEYASITVTAPTIASVSFSPSTVIGGSQSTGTVSLSGSAGPNGVTLSLSSSSSAVSAPKSVTIPQGQTAVNFTATTNAVTSEKTVTITATGQIGSKAGSLTVTPVLVVSLSLQPTTVVGGASSTGTVSISAPASKSGLVVKLSSSSSSASVAGSVSVASGKTSATFTVKTSAVATQTVATITANLNGASKTATLTITAPYLVSLTVVPATVVGGKTSTGTVTISSAAPSSGFKVTLSSSSSSAVVPSSVTIGSGKTSATFSVKTKAVKTAVSATITGSAGGGSKSATLAINP